MHEKKVRKKFSGVFFFGPPYRSNGTKTCLNATLEDLLAFSSRHNYIILVGLFFEILKISPLSVFSESHYLPEIDLNLLVILTFHEYSRCSFLKNVKSALNTLISWNLAVIFLAVQIPPKGAKTEKKKKTLSLQ